MAKIILKASQNPHKCTIDTEAMEVEIRDIYLGVSLVTDSGERLAVSMRDGGFEIHYSGDFGNVGFDAGWIEFKAGNVIYNEKRI